jgi:hypothetical protein
MLGAVALLVVGMTTAPWRQRRWRGVIRFRGSDADRDHRGRVLLAGVGSTAMLTLPGGMGSRWLGRVVDEQDGSLVGAALLPLAWRSPRARHSDRVKKKRTEDVRRAVRRETVSVIVGQRPPDVPLSSQRHGGRIVTPYG